ncbi:unnamed protein product [marine sediment metagenome]|uniref:Uncharacterized protein n=1 Tax=marine sediment metagenome TaxID=412755 RepID=X1HXH5_9ZZZZ
MGEMEKLNEQDDAKLKNGVCPKCGSQKFYKLAEGGAVVINTSHYKFAALNIACENGHKYWYGPFTSEYIGQEKVKWINKP